MSRGSSSNGVVQMMTKESLDELYADLSRNITDSDRLLHSLLSTGDCHEMLSRQQQQGDLVIIAASELRSKLTAVAGCANDMFVGIMQALSHSLRLQRAIR